MGEKKKIPRLVEVGAVGVAKMGAVGITMSAAASSFSGISMVKGMNVYSNQRLHQEVI